MSLIPSESYSFPDQFVRTIRPSKLITAKSNARAAVAPTPGPIESEPVIQELAMPEPIVSQPVVQEQAIPEPIISQPVVQELVMPEPIVSQPVVQELVMPEPIVSQPMVQELAMPEPVVSQPVIHEQVMPEPIVSQPVIQELVMPEPIISQPVIQELAMPEPIMLQPMIALAPDPVVETPVAPKPKPREVEIPMAGPMESIFFEPIGPVTPIIAKTVVDQSPAPAPIAIKPIQRKADSPAPAKTPAPVLSKPARRWGPEVTVKIEPRRNPRPIAAAPAPVSAAPKNGTPAPIIARNAPLPNNPVKTYSRTAQTIRPYGPVRTSPSVIRAPRVEPKIQAPRPVAEPKKEAPQPVAETMELFFDEDKVEIAANERATDSSFDELLLAEVPAPQARRRSRKLTGFVISEVLSLGVLGASLVLTFSHRFPNPNVVLSLNIATIAAAVVAAMVPIIFFAVGPTLPHGDN
jgi:hypothetical protein